jgi:E3 ubiquitin-protein ligase HUWE1
LPQEVETQVLSKEAIDKFTTTALSACLNLVDTLPDTVYRVCDLLITITKRNGEVWRDEMLDTLVADVSCFLIKVGYLLLSFIVC